ncbi:N-acetylmuramoyl-L-alanine amidase [Sporosarcina sp. Sa2YVA2]|uniref:N-acetylmuramoyl-L-alanine amidase n=1 Tax=Sporosarcina quadrami TaxID=2762234 RepID=A0ABR8U4V2_9BACL|nr:SH3 domain-containing protein [Sporosarcina quadrami]MBD7983065.1 N-acetylmuramoyl-L-alanine amidase [Sporosarcina quadrami]
MSRSCKWFLAFILLFSIIIDLPAVSANGETVTINTNSLNIRSGPGLTFPVTGSLKMGARVTVVSTQGDWLEIQMSSGSGWIASWLVKSDDAVKAANGTAVSKVNALNIRTEPSLNAAVIGKMNAGDNAIITSRKGEWASISRNGTDGWVHTAYITEVNAKETGKNEKVHHTVSATPEKFVVAVDVLNVRKEPGLDTKVLTQIHKNESYPIEAVEGNWVLITLDKDKSGWVYTFHGTMDASVETSNTPASAKKVTVLTNGTNIRASASTSSHIITRANAGEKLDVLSEDGEWFKVSLQTGEEAFVAKWVVSTGNVAIADTTKEMQKAPRTRGTLKGLTIVVDAGHGGHDRGTTGIQGTDEKLLTLMTAELLATKLTAAGANVVMTRDSDTYVSLRKRASISQQANADAFISLHYDANPDSSITGFTTYYTHSNQKALATHVNEGLGSSVALRDRGAQPANFLVLRENRSNSILIELGFLSNPTEERMLTTELFREQATHGIYQGLLDYFDAN